MQIASDIGLNQTGLKRRRRRLGARLLRLSVAAALIGFVFISPYEAIYAVALPFIVVPGMLAEPAFERIAFLLVLLVVLAALYVLIALMSGRKTLVLYLRRFGLSDSNRMITRAIEGGLGRHYRVLTLDDSSFKPLEVPRTERILSRIGIPIAVLLLLVTFLSWGGGQGLGLPDKLLAILFVLFPFAYGFGGILLLLPLLTLMPIVVAVLIYRWRIRRRSKLEIRSEEEIHRCLIRVQGLAAWLRRPSMLAPQALVVKVTDKLWQEVVSELAEAARLVICDVSEPTKNLIWEVEHVFAEPEIKCLFVGNGPMVRSWVQETGDEDPEAPRSWMKSLLQEQTILVFDPTGRFPQRRFNRNLRNSLDNVSDASRHRGAPIALTRAHARSNRLC